jgi:predicted transcriptional regulator
MLDTVFGGSAELMLTHLVRDRRVDAAELRRLRQLLDERLKGTSKRDKRGAESDT